MKNRLPQWFRQDIPSSIALERLRMLSGFNIHTVCQEAKCPNLGACFNQGRLTFMILGDTCTRNCRFCNVKKLKSRVGDIDLDEPRRIAEIVKRLGLKYVVITSVTRDDLKDGGASIFTWTIQLIRSGDKNIKVEVLIPDFRGNLDSLKGVLHARPDVLAHNMETVERLYPELRPQADYQVSLEILKRTKELQPSLITKSSLLLGFGERQDEVKEVMADLLDCRCDILTLGQYLAPSGSHYPVAEFLEPEKFLKYKAIAMVLGFKEVLAGPLVRSSYQAEEIYQEFIYV